MCCSAAFDRDLHMQKLLGILHVQRVVCAMHVGWRRVVKVLHTRGGGDCRCQKREIACPGQLCEWVGVNGSECEGEWMWASLSEYEWVGVNVNECEYKWVSVIGVSECVWVWVNVRDWMWVDQLKWVAVNGSEREWMEMNVSECELVWVCVGEWKWVWMSA